jgi:hypothetical protein
MIAGPVLAGPEFTLSLILIVASGAIFIAVSAGDRVTLHKYRADRVSSATFYTRRLMLRTRIYVPTLVMALAWGALWLTQRDAFALNAIGGALYLLAFQALLWLLGIRSELLGTNVPVVAVIRSLGEGHESHPHEGDDEGDMDRASTAVPSVVHHK